jgi:uncharacterized protein (TIGR02145 family)
LDEEFMEMEAFLGMPENELTQTGNRGSGELVGLTLRDDVDWDGNNTSGWSGRPGGYLYSYNFVQSSGGFWWTVGDVEGGVSNAYDRRLYSGTYGVERFSNPKSYAKSIRCLQGTAGCTDAGACNYDASASADNGACEYTSCLGCMDSAACNFDNEATINDADNCILPGTTGDSCDDGDAYTFNDVVDATGCECVGTPMVAVNGSGPCAGENVVTYDDHDYTLVEIGTQCWFAENLQANSYSNGATIPYRADAVDWSAMSVGAQVEANGDAMLLSNYGRVYNSYAVQDGRGLCPAGWHVPSDAEWTNLMDEWGGLAVAGAALKSTSLDAPAWNGTNAAGFFGLPSGQRAADGSFIEFDARGSWWSSTLSGSATNYWNYQLSDDAFAERDQDGAPASGLSVRCLQD